MRWGFDVLLLVLLMAFSVYKGTFAANTSTGSQAVSGVGFQPKALILWTTGQVNADAYEANQRLSFGIATAAAEEMVATYHSVDAGTAADVAQGLVATACIRLFSDTGPTEDCVADFTQFDSDGFTLNWSNAPASAIIVHVLALGGADLTSAKVGTQSLSSVGSPQAFTGVGFTPECVLLVGNSSGDDSTSLASISVGAATGASVEAASMIAEDDGTPNMTCATWQAASLLLLPNSTAPSQGSEADLASFDSDGFTLNVPDLPTAARTFGYLALAGGDYHVGIETQRTSAGTKATTGVGFKPAGLLVVSANLVAGGTFDATNDALLSVGGADGTREGVTWGGQDDALSTSVAKSNQTTSKAVRLAAAASTPSTNAEADLASLDSDGFTLDWTTADATAREFWYLAFGPAAAGGGGNRRRRMLLGAA